MYIIKILSGFSADANKNGASDVLSLNDVGWVTLQNSPTFIWEREWIIHQRRIDLCWWHSRWNGLAFIMGLHYSIFAKLHKDWQWSKENRLFIEEFQHLWTEGWRSIQKHQKKGTQHYSHSAAGLVFYQPARFKCHMAFYITTPWVNKIFYSDKNLKFSKVYMVK